MIISPCISICKTDPQTGYCYGCGRNNEEKKLWKLETTTNQWKNDNLTSIKKKGTNYDSKDINYSNYCCLIHFIKFFLKREIPFSILC